MIMMKITAQTDLCAPNSIASLRMLDDSGEPARARDAKAIERENRMKQVCLNCTQPKCRGTKKCFEKEMLKYD